MHSKSLFLICSTVAALAPLSPAVAQSNADTAPTAVSSAKAQHTQDSSLRKAVRRALVKTQGLDQAHIVVRARSGHVTLEGSAPDNEQVQLAKDAAQGVSGVLTVTNDLRVDEGGR